MTDQKKTSTKIDTKLAQKPAPTGEDAATGTAQKTTAQASPKAASGAVDSAFFEMREAQATGETYAPTGDEIKRRNKRNLAIALGILGFIVLVYAITILRLNANVAGGA